jgi:hypothetical protein
VTTGTVLIEGSPSSSSWTFTLPTGAGTAGQVLQTDGAGNSSWTSSPSLTTLSLTSLTVAALTVSTDITTPLLVGVTTFQSSGGVSIGTVTDPGAGNLLVNGSIAGGSVSATAAVSGASVSATGTVSGANVTATAAVSSATVSATGAISGASVSATGNVSGGNLSTTGAVLSSSATAGVGYSTGAGGTVTQLTSKSTTVVLNKINGQITLNNANLGANAIVSFTLTNSAIAVTDLVVLNHVSAGTVGSYHLNAQAAGGSAKITITNLTAGILGEAIVIGFAVIKAVTS